MPEIKCEFCPKTFKTTQALASHIKYAHQDEVGGGGSAPDFDLKQEMRDILHEVGLSRGRKLVTDTYFEIMTGDSEADLKQLDRLLAMTAVAKPLRDLVVMRWGQRIGSPVKLEPERKPEPEPQEREPESRCPCAFPTMLNSVTDPASGRRVLFCSIKEKACMFYHLAFVAPCSQCGTPLDASSLQMGATFQCPRCGAGLVRAVEGTPQVVKGYTQLQMPPPWQPRF